MHYYIVDLTFGFEKKRCNLTVKNRQARCHFELFCCISLRSFVMIFRGSPKNTDDCGRYFSFSNEKSNDAATATTIDRSMPNYAPIAVIHSTPLDVNANFNLENCIRMLSEYWIDDCADIYPFEFDHR